MRPASRISHNNNAVAITARVVRDDGGQDVIEYALLAAFVSLLAIVGAGLLGTALNNWYDSAASGVDSGAAGASGNSSGS